MMWTLVKWYANVIMLIYHSLQMFRDHAEINWHFYCYYQYLKLRALQRQSYTHYFYEATVGAGLPIISTLRGLLETGDKILRIEGIFRYVCWHKLVASSMFMWFTDIRTYQTIQLHLTKSCLFGCHSGTLSYIFNNFIGNRTFSEVVAEAKQEGFTEPDPRDDLSGTDVCRKVSSTRCHLP